MTTLGILVLVIAAALSLVGGVMFLVAAFRVSALWGVVVLFVPFAGFVFAFKYWPEAKRGFLLSLAGGVLTPVAGFLMFTGAVSGMQQEMVEHAARQDQQQMNQSVQAPSLETPPQPDSQPNRASTVAASTSQADGQASSAREATVEMDAAREASRGEAAALRPTVEINPLDSLPIDDSAVPAREVAPTAPRVVIPVRAASDHVGQRLEFVRTDGRIFSAELVAVDGGQLRVKRDVPGGTMVYPVRRADIAKLRKHP